MSPRSLFRFGGVVLALLTLAAGGCTDALQRNRTAAATAVPQPPYQPAPGISAVADIQPQHMEMARQLIEKGFFGVALQQLAEAGRQRPADVEIFTLKGVCLRETERYDEARQAFMQAMTLAPAHAPAYNGMGLLHDMLDQRDEAAAWYLRAIELDPGRAEYFNNLGYSALLDGRLDKAEDHLRRSVTLNPSYSRAVHNLAICYGLQNRDAQCWHLLRQHASPAVAYNNMGAICQMRGDAVKAREMYVKALAEDPEMVLARTNLERLSLETKRSNSEIAK